MPVCYQNLSVEELKWWISHFEQCLIDLRAERLAYLSGRLRHHERNCYLKKSWGYRATIAGLENELNSRLGKGGDFAPLVH